jgi:hypothetical protein
MSTGQQITQKTTEFTAVIENGFSCYANIPCTIVKYSNPCNEVLFGNTAN